jgi:hypothetical protein
MIGARMVVSCDRSWLPPRFTVGQEAVEWLYWDVDVLFPPVFGCYAVQLGQRELLPIGVEPAITDYHRRRAEVQ